MKRLNIFAAICGLAIAAPLSGCMGDFLTPREDPTKYYLIKSADNPQVLGGAENVMLNISQVRMPAYMSRQQIVSAKDGSSEIVISDIHRLPEFPVDAFTRTIAANISKMAKSENVYAYPGVAPEPDCIGVRVIIAECIGVVGKDLSFKARWELIKPEGSKIVAQKAKLFVRKIPAQGGYDAYISAMDRGLSELSEDIVKGIVEFKRQNYKN